MGRSASRLGRFGLSRYVRKGSKSRRFAQQSGRFRFTPVSGQLVATPYWKRWAICGPHMGVNPMATIGQRDARANKLTSIDCCPI